MLGMNVHANAANVALSNDQIRRIAPSIFATDKHSARSDKYTYIPTVDLLNGLRNEGFLPVQVQQSKTRRPDHVEFTKHLLRLRREDQLGAAEARDVVIINSHNGSSAYHLLAGIFRGACSNGLIFGKFDSEIHVPHKGDVLGRVIEGAYTVIKDFDQVGASIDGMKSVTLNQPQRLAFAKAALALRFEDPANSGIQPEQIVEPRRWADRGTDLWTTFNVVQEHVVRGGVEGLRRDRTNRLRRVTTREVKGIDGNVALNRSLWTLAEEMKKLVA